MVGKKGFVAIPVVIIVLAIIIFFSWFFWPSSVDDSSQKEKENTTIKGNNNKYESSQLNEREFSVVHLENADTIHGWMFTATFFLMVLVGTGAFCHQRRVAAPHRERLEEGIAELRGVLIDRGYIQGRKKRLGLSKKHRKVAKKVKKLQEKLKREEIDISEEEV